MASQPGPVRCCKRCNPLDGQTASRLWAVQLQLGLSRAILWTSPAVYGSGSNFYAGAKACIARESELQLLPFKGHLPTPPPAYSTLHAVLYCSPCTHLTKAFTASCSTSQKLTRKRQLSVPPLVIDEPRTRCTRVARACFGELFYFQFCY